MRSRPRSVPRCSSLRRGVALTADRVRLRSGKIVEGMFIGGDSKTVRDPARQRAGVRGAARRTRSPWSSRPRKPPRPRRQPAASASRCDRAAAPTPAPRPAVTVPAGTTLNVRLARAIDVDASQAGQTFKAMVDDPVMIGGVDRDSARRIGATLQAVKVQQSGKMKGSDKISLKLNSFGFGGMVYEVATAYVETKGQGEGKKTARKVGGGAGLGAIVGGIAGGGRGGDRRRRRRR